MENVKNLYKKIKDNVSLAVVGKDNVTKLLFAALICGGHVIITDVPGTAKTLIAKAFASSFSLSFKRIQFTPDLLPSDITGVQFFNIKKSEFEFLPGPVFANVVMADEINRATPKTQAGLLECMAEYQITVDGAVHKLNTPFMVIATQNPVESAGVYELPEAQLDRFLISTDMKRPSFKESVEILKKYDKKSKEPKILPVADEAELKMAQKELDSVYVSEPVYSYIAALCEATHSAEGVELGVSVRAALGLLSVAKCFAAVDGRDYLLPDDVQACAVNVLSHRLVLNATESYKPGAAEKIITDVLKSVKAPTEDINAYKLK